MMFVMLHSEVAYLRQNISRKGTDAHRLVKFHNNFLQLRNLKEAHKDEFYYKSSFYKRDLIVNEIVKKIILEMIDQYCDTDIDTLIIVNLQIDNEMEKLSAIKD